MTTDIQLSPRRELDLSIVALVQSVAPIIHASRYFGVASPEQAAAIMLKGYEIGLPVTAAFEFIQIIEGKPTLIPRGALALIHQSGQLVSLDIQEAPGSCTVTMRRSNGVSYTTIYTIKDAEQAGLVKDKSAWQKYQANMLRWRAIGFCADIVFPDVLAGMKTADQMGAAVNADGDVIEEGAPSDE